jgi:hypothetical protein
MANSIYAEGQRSARPPWRLVALGACLTLLAWQVLSPRSVGSAGAEQQDDRPKTAFEPTDWPLRPIALIYIGLLVLLVISSFVLIAAYPTSMPDVDRTLRIAPPGPRLQTEPASDLRAFRADEAKRLNTYYWIDKQKGVVHIPIQEAMKKVAKTGLPGFPKAQE